ncbi:30S ribosomal protein S16 [Nocardioides sp. CFH 31398]|nr:30S ribosomal protein S16 [Nocardioides sp. CFH 31398]MCH1868669.1 30S ribosomal protein S16 [Nocardioides sp. CFH 31398]
MAVKIRLKRLGKVRVPQYRIVVVDSRKKRDGRVIEEIGTYQPKDEPSVITVESERAQYWLGVGAQPTETVESLLRVTGDWQKFKGMKGTEGRLKHAPEKRSKLDIFNEALKEAGSETVEATTPKADKADKAPKTEKQSKDESSDAPSAAEKTPADETPAVAETDAAVEETKAVDAERQQEPEDKDGASS